MIGFHFSIYLLHINLFRLFFFFLYIYKLCIDRNLKFSMEEQVLWRHYSANY